MTSTPADVPPEPSRGDRLLPRAFIVLMSLAGAAVVIAGVRGASSLVGPAFLALVLTIASYPLRRWLDRYMPGWAASLLCLAFVYVLVVVLAIAMIAATARFATLLTEYEDQFTDMVGNITDALKHLGVDPDKLHSISDSFDLGKLADIVGGVLSGALGLVSNLVFILTLILFMTVDGNQFPRHLAAAHKLRPALVDAMLTFASATRSYLVVSTVFGLIVAVLDTLALALMGVPAPLVWGLVAFLTNYIPNIGFVIGMVPPAILALFEGGPGLMLAVIAVYCALNIVIQSVIQPKVVGDAVGLSTTLTFISLVFWSWVLGPVGAVMAIPLSLLVRAVLIDADPNSHWLLPLVSNSDMLGPKPKEKPKEKPKRRTRGARAGVT